MSLNKSLIPSYDTDNLIQAMKDLSLENSLKRLSSQTNQFNIETITHTLTMIGKGVKRLFWF